MTFRNIIGGNLEHYLNENKFGVNYEVDNFVKNHGKEIIQSLLLIKRPFINSNIVGELSPSFKRKNTYDKLYHPRLIINGRYMLDKTSQLNVKSFSGNLRGFTTLNVPLKKQITIYDLLKNTKSYYGVDKINNYNVSSNNCQHLLIAMLKSNGLLNDENKTFIKQDTDDSIKGLEPKITPITDLANKFHPVVGGFV